jgi:hypothetical protein
MIIIDTKGPNGNAWTIMGITHRYLKETGRDNEWSSIQKRMMSGNYEKLCAIAEEVTHGHIQFDFHEEI